MWKTDVQSGLDMSFIQIRRDYHQVEDWSPVPRPAEEGGGGEFLDDPAFGLQETECQEHETRSADGEG